jgi:hypothetical protein
VVTKAVAGGSELVERRTFIPHVVGSIPTEPTKLGSDRTIF